MTSPTMATIATNNRYDWEHNDNDPEHNCLEKVKQHVASTRVEIVLISEMFSHFLLPLALLLEGLLWQREV